MTGEVLILLVKNRSVSIEIGKYVYCSYKIELNMFTVDTKSN